MSRLDEARSGVGNRVRRAWDALPRELGRGVLVAAWVSFAVQVLLVGTGGAVRLTASGLGCPTWPLCTSDSLISTPEMGIHGLIEFGNRTLTGVVGLAALAVLLLVVRTPRRDLVRLASVVVLGVVAQALVGGITVLTGLNPFVVGFHYLASVALACVCAAFLVRLRGRPVDAVDGARDLSRWFRVALVLLVISAVVTIVLGVLTTGAGPHSGDPLAGRNGFDAAVLQHVHAWPSYVLVAVTGVLALAARLRRLPGAGWLLVLLGLQVVQVLVGLYQARNGLPVLAVGVHMVLAALMAAATTVAVMLVLGRVGSGRESVV